MYSFILSNFAQIFLTWSSYLEVEFLVKWSSLSFFMLPVFSTGIYALGIQLLWESCFFFHRSSFSVSICSVLKRLSCHMTEVSFSSIRLVVHSIKLYPQNSLENKLHVYALNFVVPSVVSKIPIPAPRKLSCSSEFFCGSWSFSCLLYL